MPPTYDELFQRLERNVERLQSDEVGLVERLELCRHSRALVVRCVQELEKLGTEIEELFLEDLLDQVNELGNPRPGARRRPPRRSASPPEAPLTDAETDSQSGSTIAQAPAGQPSAPEAAGPITAVDRRARRTARPVTPAAVVRDSNGLLATHLRIVASILRSVGHQLTLAALVEHGGPAALARLLALPGAARSPEAVHHVTLLLTDDRVLPSALRALARLAEDPDVAEWFDHGLAEGRDVLSELARELSPSEV